MNNSDGNNKRLSEGGRFLIGLASGVVTFILFLLVFIGVGWLGWTDGGDTDDSREKNSLGSLLLSIVLGIAVGFFVARSFKGNKNNSKSKEDAE
jgi:hypothetical protein